MKTKNTWRHPGAILHLAMLTIFVLLQNHGVSEYPELERTHQGYQSPTPGQDDHKSHTMCLIRLTQCFLTSSRQAWCSDPFPGEPVPGPSHPLGLLGCCSAPYVALFLHLFGPFFGPSSSFFRGPRLVVTAHGLGEVTRALAGKRDSFWGLWQCSGPPASPRPPLQAREGLSHSGGSVEC